MPRPLHKREPQTIAEWKILRSEAAQFVANCERLIEGCHDNGPKFLLPRLARMRYRRIRRYQRIDRRIKDIGRMLLAAIFDTDNLPDSQ